MIEATNRQTDYLLSETQRAKQRMEKEEGRFGRRNRCCHRRHYRCPLRHQSKVNCELQPSEEAVCHAWAPQQTFLCGISPRLPRGTPRFEGAASFAPRSLRRRLRAWHVEERVRTMMGFHDHRLLEEPEPKARRQGHGDAAGVDYCPRARRRSCPQYYHEFYFRTKQ